jgi:hypothetical protein
MPRLFSLWKEGTPIIQPTLKYETTYENNLATGQDYEKVYFYSRAAIYRCRAGGGFGAHKRSRPEQPLRLS